MLLVFRSQSISPQQSFIFEFDAHDGVCVRGSAVNECRLCHHSLLSIRFFSTHFYSQHTIGISIFESELIKCSTDSLDYAFIMRFLRLFHSEFCTRRSERLFGIFRQDCFLFFQLFVSNIFVTYSK